MNYPPHAGVVPDALIAIIQRLPRTVLISAHADGAAVLADYEQHRADLVLTDYEMPVMDGLMLMQQVRQRDPHLPILLVSGNLDIETAARAAGADQVLAKPVPPAVLLAAILELLKP